MIKIKSFDGKVSNRLNEMVAHGKDIRPILNLNVYRIYQNAQRERWKTEGASQGMAWDKLNPKYAERKKILFREYPGKGTKMLIATGRLYKSVIGPGDKSNEHRKIVEARRLTILTTVPYAKHVDELRSISKFDKATIDKVKDVIRRYLMKRVKPKVENEQQ